MGATGDGDMNSPAADAAARCRIELAEIERLLRSGHPNVEGLCLALCDWSIELHMIESGVLPQIQTAAARRNRSPKSKRAAGVQQAALRKESVVGYFASR